MDIEERDKVIQLKEYVDVALAYYIMKTDVEKPSQTTVLELINWLSEKSEEI